MNNILDFNKCSNCGACYNICPKDAIWVNEDGLFYALEVDEDKCSGCGICKKVCPVNTKNKMQDVKSAYALIHNYENILKKSSSGGAFSAIADLVLKDGGVVFGAAYSNDFRTVEMMSTNERDLDSLRRSKYVESKVGYSFREVKEILVQGKTVLYCGAPCQIAGLIRYLGKNYENLITCDFSCGGMPAHGIYRQWLEKIEQDLKGPICEVNFRSKKYGWINTSISIKTQNREYSKSSYSDYYYYYYFGREKPIREYCMECEFANNHYADIILADLWKYKTISKIKNRNKGISLVITNSQKGERVITRLAKQVALTVLDTQKASYNLYDKKCIPEVIDKRKTFLDKCNSVGFWKAVNGVKLKSNLKFRIKCFVKRIIGRD